MTKNTHMTHIEDKVIYGGVDGTRQAILALRELRKMLGGEKDGNVSVKWDGAPAIFAGTDPSDGQFFVAKKGIFNKNPKVYKSPADVDADTSGDLALKLKDALKYLPSLGIKGVIQGDFLFSKSDISKKKIKGQSYVTFHPNTIMYAVPTGTAPAEAITSSRMGVVWHTTYKGSTFETMKASYGVDISRFNKSRHVWSQDAMLRDMTSFTMTKNDTRLVDNYLSQAGTMFSKISSTTLRQLESNPQLAQMIETYNNSFVRKGQAIGNTAAHVNGLIRDIQNRFAKTADQRSTVKGKAAQFAKRDEILKFFSPANKKSLKLMFDLQKIIVLAKLKVINNLNRLSKVSSFVKTQTGYKTTGPEGYVAIDRLGGDAVKIVDRMEFSYNNFSPDILKGWDKPGR
tara:strand:- start:157 stop:1356 length:1200 start_codon:yes stop_codon:yes gene_type:complete